MKQRTYHSLPRGGTAVGVDVGATLAKLAIHSAQAGVHFELHPAQALEAIAARVQDAAPDTVGLTGGGAEALEKMLDGNPSRVNEFSAWGAGARAMLSDGGAAASKRHLIVSVGTGTSVLLVDGPQISRIGGTALGGGTVVGLGSALLGTSCFDEIATLAGRGTRKHVDLLVSDIYRSGETALLGDLTASNFGRLARAGREEAPSREDLAHAIMGLVGENVALVCGGLAAASQVSHVVFGGSTLRGNRTLANLLEQVTRSLGRTPLLLPEGAWVGALGALLLATAEPTEPASPPAR